MPSYSYDEFKNDYVHALEKDFTSPHGHPAVYAAGQPFHYGQEAAKFQLGSATRAASVNADETLLAVGQEHDIHIYSVEDRVLLHVLKGHISHVDSVVFHPTEPKQLISCARCDTGGSVEADATVLFWDLDAINMKGLLNETALDQVSQGAVGGALAELEAVNSLWRPNEQEKASMAMDVAKTIETLNVQSLVQDKQKIHGCLVTSFGSRPFNRDGSGVIFLPGKRPKSNGVDGRWVICIWDTLQKKIKLTLSGHTDDLMWVGFSPDDRFIASVSWDKTFRIWSHADGTLLHTFRSNTQNWTGGFSPDSRFFAGVTVGQLWVWDVIHGMEVATHTWTGGWCRHLDWSPDGKQILVGGSSKGLVFIFDIKIQRVIQERVLSLEQCPEDARNRMGEFLEVLTVQYMDRGRKIAYRTSGEDAVEVYDLVMNQKWRFAPGKGEGAWADIVLPLEKLGMIASVDADAVRFWRVDTSGD